MIAKVPAKRGDGRSSFGTLGQYISGVKIDIETGEVLRREIDVSLKTNCLSLNTAAAEMWAAANENTRVQDPVYHCVLSWRPGEQPTDKQVFEAAEAAQKAIGMAGHQYVYAVHRDTENVHVHLMINRVHPDTAKAVYPSRDFFKLDECMRQVELAQKWQHDNGPYEVKNGKIVRSEKQRSAPTLTTKAKDYEAATQCESLVTYAQKVSADAIEAIKSGDWQELHSALRKHGLEIREAGQGFRIYSLTDTTQTPIKASDMSQELGGGKLKKKLGDFKPAARILSAEKPERTYNKYREAKADQRAERREQRAEARRDLRQRYENEKARHAERTKADSDALKKLHKSLYSAINDEAKKQRAAIRAQGYTPEAKKALYSVVAMQTIQKREQLKAELEQQRKLGKMQSYKAWVSDKAAGGDAAAIAQLKGWEYSYKRRKAKAEREAEEAAELGAIHIEHDKDPYPPRRIVEDITWSVNRQNGDVTYKLDGKAAFKDTGKQLSFISQTDQSIVAGLMLARQKFGPELTVTGPVEFQRRVAEQAVKNKMNIKFKDPALDAYRQKLEAEAKTNSQKAHSNEHSKSSHRSQQTEPEPPPITRERLRNVPGSDLVRNGQANGILHEDVQRNVGERQQDSDQRLQRKESSASRNGGVRRR